MIQYEELGNRFVREGLAQLLRNPGARRMTRDIAVQDAATIVADDEEAVQHAESKRWHRKEVHRGYGFAVVAQKSKPTFSRLWASGRSPHPAGDAGFRYLEAKHEKFAVDPGRTPSRILRDHLEDQLTNLL